MSTTILAEALQGAVERLRSLEDVELLNVLR